jgi:hypothetical protein
MSRHVIAKCTNGKILRYRIGDEDNRIRIIGGVGFREMARKVETLEDARNVLKLIPIPAPIMDVRIVDDTLEDIHQYLEE